jgi:integrin beta 1
MLTNLNRLTVRFLHFRNNGQLCSGHGSCVCGNCSCDLDWSGDDCSCLQNEAECSSPYNDLLCSGSGLCQCSRCKCNSDSTKSGFFTGNYCEIGPNEAYPCSILRNCVECQAFESGPLAEKCSELCNFDLQQVDSENATEAVWQQDKCSFENAAGNNIHEIFYRKNYCDRI